MSYLSIRHLSNSVADFSLKDINLEIDKGEYFVLLGQSGSGKPVCLKPLLDSIKVQEVSFTKKMKYRKRIRNTETLGLFTKISHSFLT